MKPLEKNPLEALAEQMRKPSGFFSENAERVKNDSANAVAYTGGIIQLIYNFFALVFSLFSVPAEVFLRYNFGERYLTLGRMILGYILITYYWSFSTSLLNLTRGKSAGWDMFTSAFRLCFVLGCVFHVIWIQIRKSRGVRCHSRYAGDSLPLWRRLPFYEAIGGQYNVQLYLEPLLLMILSVILHGRSAALGEFLFFCSLSLFAKGWSQHSAFKGRLQDITDRQIEAEQLAEAGKRWRDPAGLATDGYVIPANPWNRPPKVKRAAWVKFARSVPGGVGVALYRGAARVGGLLNRLPVGKKKPRPDLVEESDPPAPSPQPATGYRDSHRDTAPSKYNYGTELPNPQRRLFTPASPGEDQRSEAEAELPEDPRQMR